MTEPVRAYWFCQKDMTSPFAPKERWEVGQTRELEGEIVPCKWGYHGSPSPWDALEYANGPVLCLIELSGTIVFDMGLAVASRKTLVAAVNLERELRLFAADCAERVLHIWEAAYPEDMRPRLAIQAAREYAHGRIDAKELEEREEAAAAAAEEAAEEVGANEASVWAAEGPERASAWAAWAAASAAGADVAAGAWEAADAAALAAELKGPSLERTWQRAEFERRFGNLFDGVSA